MTMADEDDEVLREFLVESNENLDRLERELVAFEREGANPERIAAIFRTIHTIKGTAGFFGFVRLQSVTHVAENLLSKIREGELALTEEMVSALLVTADACRVVLGYLEAGQGEGNGNDERLIQILTDLQEPKGDKPAAAAPAPAPVAAAPAPAPVVEAAPAPAPVAAPAPASVAAPAPAADEAGGPAAAAHGASESSIRVDIHLLDELMDLAGELVLARNQMQQFAASSRDTGFVRTAQRLNLITSKLQEGVMKTRMQPIAGVWNKLPRVVRDLSASLGKQVRLELEGKDTGLDRSILEAIKDPLTHLVRNAVDHGLELPADRAAAGKAAEGVLRLRAAHEGGQVSIEITDDGRGIDPERIRAKAIAKGLLTAQSAAAATPDELVRMIFAPGFSTAEAVTNVSGRGVGMDVVKTNIERIGGTVDVESVVGAGTTIRIKIPLTLAIIPALIVTAGAERYAIPQVGVVELVRLGAGRRAVEYVHGAPVYRLRGDLLPLIYLDRVLGLVAGGSEASSGTIVVVNHEGRNVGLVVDTVLDTEEIVVKPLGKRLKSLSVYAGATILGDGRVALILDVRGIAALAGLTGKARPTAVVDVASRKTADTGRSLLVVAAGGGRRLAVPLDEVARLEDFPVTALERAGHYEVVQYRDALLPLVRMGDALGMSSDAGADQLSVVVYTCGGRDIGLVVEGILDIVESSQTGAVDASSRRHGLIGSLVVDGRVTDLVDVGALVGELAGTREETFA
jgi:two-component system chemotaxis sensor kinase CheA